MQVDGGRRKQYSSIKIIHLIPALVVVPKALAAYTLYDQTKVLKSNQATTVGHPSSILPPLQAKVIEGVSSHGFYVVPWISDLYELMIRSGIRQVSCLRIAMAYKYELPHAGSKSFSRDSFQQGPCPFQHPPTRGLQQILSVLRFGLRSTLVRVMLSHIGGFLFMGPKSELEFALGSFLDGNSSAEELQKLAADLRKSNWNQMVTAGIKYIPSNTFSYHNQVLDTTAMLGAVPARYGWNGGEIGFDTYFSMARGNGSVPAMEMTSWFDTNYHYTIPELGPDVKFSYASHKAVDEFKEATALGVHTVPVLIGPVSYLLLSKPAEGVENSFSLLSLTGKILPVYKEVVAELKAAGASWIQFDELTLVRDLDSHQLQALTHAYSELESSLSGLNVLIQTYFADVPAETYETLTTLKGVVGFGFDLVCGTNTLRLVKGGFPSGKYLFAGVVDGRNIWANDLDSSLKTLQALEGVVGKDKIVVSTSCPLLHTDVELVNETGLDGKIERPAFAAQKVLEVAQALVKQKDEVPGVSVRDSFPVEGVAFKKTFSYEVCEQKPHEIPLFNIAEPAPVEARPSIPEDVRAAEILMSFKENQVYPTPATEATVLLEVQMEVSESETRPYAETVSDFPSERAKGIEEEACRLKGREKVIKEGGEEKGKEKSMDILHELEIEHNGIRGSAKERLRREGKKGDDDERIYEDFTPMTKIPKDSNFDSPFFLSAVHQTYDSLQKRGVMQPRYINFSCFKDNGFSASDLLEKYKSVCQLSEDVYSEAIALFYSGLSFPSPDEFVSQFAGQQFTLKVGELASMLSLSCSIFKRIPVQDTEAYKAITRDPSFERERGSHVYQKLLPLDMKILQKVLIMCLRPKAASTNDITKYEAKLLWAIKNNIEFSLPHTILLHMHRTIRKSSGKLPYGALIMMILREKGITIPIEFKTRRIQTLEFGAESLRKMKLGETNARVIDLRVECLKVADGDENAVTTALENKMRETEGDLSRKRKQKGYAEKDGPVTCHITSALYELMGKVTKMENSMTEVKNCMTEVKALLEASPHHLFQVDKAVSHFNPVEPCLDPDQTSRSTSLSQQKRKRE